MVAASRTGGVVGRIRTLPPRVESRPGAMPVILALSFAAHVAVIAAAALLARPAAPKPVDEVAVEVVAEVPREKPAQAAEETKAQQADGKAERESAKAEPPKPPEPVVERAPAEQARAEQARVEQLAAEQARAEQARAEQARAEQAEQNKQAEQARQAAQAEQEKAQQAEAQTMRDELARLQAEQQALQAEAQEPRPVGGQQANGQDAGQPAGVGALASSLQAIALPQETTDGEGELAGYQAVVFSRLAKAKSVGRQLGIPGSAGVSFAIDEHGALKSLRLAAPSGIRKLDEEALAIVRRAAPFPVPPEGAQRSFEANVSFIAGG